MPAHANYQATSTNCRSRSGTRITSRDPTPGPGYLPPDPNSLLYPEGAVTEDDVELLHEFVHPHHRIRTSSQPSRADGNIANGVTDIETPSDEDEAIGAEIEARQSRPWYRRPSPWWLLCTLPISATVMAACTAPRVAIYTDLACRVHRPEYSMNRMSFGAQDTALYRGSGNLFEMMVVSPYSLDMTPLNPIAMGITNKTAHSAQDNAERQRQCAADPKVQAAVSKLTAVLTSAMGVLACMTTAWWGLLSDRYGRKRVMTVSLFGLLIEDFTFIFVYWFVSRLPGNYWFLIIGPVVNGLLGGMTTGVAAMHAYQADCTLPAERARIFSLSLGILFIGLALGPTLGSFLIAATGNVLSVFYAATTWHICYTTFVVLVLPESLVRGAMLKSRRRHATRQEEEEQTRSESEAREGVTGTHRLSLLKIARRAGRTLKRVFAFMSPLSVFAPKINDASEKTGKKDFSLTLVAIAYGFYSLVMGSYQTKFQYAAATFGWSPEELGYWLSLVGASRAVYLTLILPIIINICTYKGASSRSKSIPQSERIAADATGDATTPLLSVRSPSRSRSPHPPTDNADGATEKHHHSPSFNLGLARWSLALEVVCYTIIPLAPTPITFTIFGMLASCGGGFNPALQSLALDLFSKSGETETGRLFGAMSVIHALTSQIIGPSLFSFTYVKTVSTYPKTIFFVSTAAVTLSFIALVFVRLQDFTMDDKLGSASAGEQNEESTV